VKAAIVISALAGCVAEDLTGPEYGARLARDPSLGGSANPFACTTCHSTEMEPGDHRYSGYSLYDSAFRTAFWGGSVRSLLQAVSFCTQYFMAGSPVDPDSDEARGLYEYLESLSATNPAPVLPLTVVENVTQVGRGDPARGKIVYQEACQSCHGEAGTGRGRLPHPKLVEEDIVLPQWTRTYPTDFPGVDPGLVVIEKVRHGQFFGVGGNMPLFAREMLADDDLAALLSYLDL
jgi:thiosulfate dehydrogenase